MIIANKINISIEEKFNSAASGNSNLAFLLTSKTPLPVEILCFSPSK